NKYFQPKKYNPLELIYGDAFEYVMNTKERYDIVIVDVFIEDNVPKQFMRQDFVEALDRILSLDGILFFNKMVNTLRNKNEAEKLHSLCTITMGKTSVEKVQVNS